MTGSHGRLPLLSLANEPYCGRTFLVFLSTKAILLPHESRRNGDREHSHIMFDIMRAEKFCLDRVPLTVGELQLHFDRELSSHILRVRDHVIRRHDVESPLPLSHNEAETVFGMVVHMRLDPDY